MIEALHSFLSPANLAVLAAIWGLKFLLTYAGWRMWKARQTVRMEAK